MGVEIRIFIQETYKETAEWEEIEGIANKFYDYLTRSETQEMLKLHNIPGAVSQSIEEIITPYAEKLGFTSQKKGLFEGYKVSKLTPDYYRPIIDTGIIILLSIIDYLLFKNILVLSADLNSACRALYKY